jgi:phage tail-like protein
MWHAADALAGYAYRLVWDGRLVAGFRGLAAPPRTVRAIGTVTAPLVSAPVAGAQSKYEALTLTAGVSRDAEFARWASTLSNFGAAPRLDAVLGIFDSRERVVRVLRLHRVWISKFQGTDLNADGNDVAIDSLTLEHEGLELESDDDGDDDHRSRP